MGPSRGFPGCLPSFCCVDPRRKYFGSKTQSCRSFQERVGLGPKCEGCSTARRPPSAGWKRATLLGRKSTCFGEFRGSQICLPKQVLLGLRRVVLYHPALVGRRAVEQPSRVGLKITSCWKLRTIMCFFPELLPPKARQTARKPAGRHHNNTTGTKHVVLETVM